MTYDYAVPNFLVYKIDGYLIDSSGGINHSRIEGHKGGCVYMKYIKGVVFT